MTNKKPEQNAVAKLREIYFEMRKNRKPSKELLEGLKKRKTEAAKNSTETKSESNKKVASPHDSEAEL